MSNIPPPSSLPLLSSSSPPLLLSSSPPLLLFFFRLLAEQEVKKKSFWGPRRRGDRRRLSQFTEHDLCEQVGTLDDASSGYHGRGLLPFPPVLEALVVVQESTDDLLPVLGRLCGHQQLARSEVLSGGLRCPGPDDGLRLTCPDPMATCEMPGFGPDEEYDGTSGPWRMRKQKRRGLEWKMSQRIP